LVDSSEAFANHFIDTIRDYWLSSPRDAGISDFLPLGVSFTYFVATRRFRSWHFDMLPFPTEGS
jgi:hypothetical protein